MPVQIYNLQRQDKGSSLMLTFLIRNLISNMDVAGSFVTEPYLINDIAQARFKFEQKQNISANYLHASRIAAFPMTYMISIKLASKLLEDTVKMNVTCKSLNYLKQLTCTENWTDWLVMGEKAGTIASNNVLSFDPIEIGMVISETRAVTFANLYSDEDLTDFYLSAPDGKIPVHKACLAAHTDVFKAMLREEWKETESGQVQLLGANLNTLQHFKKYIYLGTLPNDEDVLRQLLIFASCYMIEALRKECIYKLSSQATGENLHNLVEYACENNIPELVIALLEQTPDSVIKRAHEKRFQKDESFQCISPIPSVTIEDDLTEKLNM